MGSITHGKRVLSSSGPFAPSARVHRQPEGAFADGRRPFSFFKIICQKEKSALRCMTEMVERRWRGPQPQVGGYSHISMNA